MTRPQTVQSGAYLATLTKNRPGPWGIETTWEITREGVRVGTMFQGGGGYGERPHCSLNPLVWSGKIPRGASDPKSPDYGIGLDVGPHDTRELALADFARRADRLIAWRAAWHVAHPAGEASW